jgi:Icc-related predicted phosphoesterase
MMRKIGGRLGWVGVSALFLLLAGCAPSGPGGARNSLRLEGDDFSQVNVAAAEEFKPFSFVLAADPQIGFGSGGAAGDEERFVQLAHQVNEMSPDFVLVAGDLTQWGTCAEWQRFDDALAKFRVPVHLLMGNHEFQGHPQRDLAYFREHYGRDYYSFTRNNCEFVNLNASVIVRAASSEFYRREADRQWTWLERTLAASKAAGRTHIFLVMHQPPFVHDENEPRGLLHSDWPAGERKRLLELARRYGVHDMLCGHLHRNLELHSGGLDIYVVGGTSVVWGKEPCGFRLFNVTRDGLEQQFVRLDPAVKTRPLAAANVKADAKSPRQ